PGAAINDQAVCGQCHTAGPGPYFTPAQIAEIAPVIHNSANGDIDCTFCHNLVTIPPSIVNHPTGAGTPGTGAAACNTCHLADGMTIHTDAPIDDLAICNQCHTWTQPQITAANIHGPQSGMDCVVCHGAGGNPGDITLLAHPTDPNTPGPLTNSSSCRTCHLAGTQAVHAGATVDVQATCGQCHGGSAGSGATQNGAPYFN